MPLSTLVVVNPMSAGGRTGRQWAEIREALTAAGVAFDYRLTSAPTEATEFTRAALRTGCERVVAVGGDGTLNEVVNGFFDGTTHDRIAPSAVLGLIPSGTGGDFRRSVGIPVAPASGAALLARGDVRTCDVGRIDFANDAGGPRVHHFINIADCGIGGDVAMRVNRSRKVAGGKVTFLLASVAALLRFRNRLVRIEVDGKAVEQRVQNVVVANGRYFGGSMLVAPDADVADGLLDVIILGDIPRRRAIMDMRHVYDGTHIGRPWVTVLRTERVSVTPLEDDPLLFDIEGEQVGQAPATLTCLPAAIRLAAPLPIEGGCSPL
jgi:YegS/Rv2252/BmrU family lipid kinase